MSLLRIESLLKEAQEHSSQLFYYKYMVLKDRLLTNEYEHWAAGFPSGTNHGPSHIKRVLEYLDRLLGKDPLKDELLTPYELFLTMMSILYHDVGLLRERRTHADFSKLFLEDEQNEYVGGNLRKGEGDYTTVSGGYVNIARSSFASVGGGLHNRALGRNSTIGGGAGNRAKGFYATVSGGQHNIARAIGATVAGGGGMCMIGCNDGNVDIKNIGNIDSGRYTTVSGGAGNIAGAFGRTHIINELTDSELDENGQAYLKKHIGDYATVSGGHDNAARSSYTTVGGGFYNMAGMDYLKVINGDDAYNGNYATV